jgi:VCBS repeat protein
VLWYMNGSVLTSGTFTTPSSFDINYRLVGVADFSNPLDGKPDFVWRHQTTGDNLIWFMNGANQIASVPTTALTDTRWAIVATGDYSFDGKNDLVWRQQESGENVMWFMNGAVMTGGTFTNPSSFPDVRWKMVGPR